MSDIIDIDLIKMKNQYKKETTGNASEGMIVEEENIRYFGICNCSTPPDTETVYLVDQNGEGRITGKCCRPEIKQGKWQQTKEDATLADHNIVMQSSYLICNCGQCKIQIETDGWEYMDEHHSIK